MLEKKSDAYSNQAELFGSISEIVTSIATIALAHQKIIVLIQRIESSSESCPRCEDLRKRILSEYRGWSRSHSEIADGISGLKLCGLNLQRHLNGARIGLHAHTKPSSS